MNIERIDKILANGLKCSARCLYLAAQDICHMTAEKNNDPPPLLSGTMPEAGAVWFMRPIGDIYAIANITNTQCAISIPAIAGI